jgi:23S rRNA (uracil1939-C5)-methyltransferase
VRHTLDIVDLAQGGEGVARAGDRVVFVPYAAPGDRVVADVPGGTGPAHATLLQVLSSGEARIEAPCGHFGPGEDAGCGGCEWLHLAYPAQLEAKQRAFAETLRRIGRLVPRGAHDCEVGSAAPSGPGTYHARPIIASPSPLRYRARAKFHLDRGTGRLVFFRRRSHEPVQVRECHLLEPELDRLREAVGPALAAARLEPREVTLEWSRHDGRGAAFLQLPSLGASTRQRAEVLLATLPALAGVVLGAEGVPLSIVGDPVLRQWRRPRDSSAGIQCSRPDVFQQANREGNAVLVETALALLRPDGEDVLELFCGAGNFTGPLAAHARSVHAVDAQGPSLDLARADRADGASGPGVGDNVRFFAGDALALARAFSRETGPSARRFGAALLDPPRDGARGIGPALRDLGVPRAVYVSCDPATLARDLKACGESGYRVEVVQAVDMFPQTHHVEGVALIVR